MTDDIRAAAERLRRLHSGETMAVVYERPNSVHEDTGLSFVDPQSLAENYCDEQRIVDAYLELVPSDDGEPVDFADYRMGPLVTLRIGICGIGRWGVFVRHGSNEEFLLSEVANRGDVRRLLAALGVTP